MKDLPGILRRAVLEAVVESPYNYRLPEVPYRTLGLPGSLQPRCKAFGIVFRVTAQKLHQPARDPCLVADAKHRCPQEAHRLVRWRGQAAGLQQATVAIRFQEEEFVVPADRVRSSISSTRLVQQPRITCWESIVSASAGCS